MTLNLDNNELHTYSSKCQGLQRKGILKEVLSRIILAQRLCHIAIKVFRSIITTAMCKCTVIRLFSMTRTLFKLSDQGYIYFIWWTFLKFYVIVISFSKFACFAFKFFIQLILQTPRTSCGFPFVVGFVTSTSGRFVKLKSNRIKLYFQEYKSTKFNKTIIPFALVGYEIGYTISYPTRAHGIIVKYLGSFLIKQFFHSRFLDMRWS